MKWIELTVILKDYSRFNEMLKILVKPYIEELYDNNIIFNWHYFREPSLCWRIYANDLAIDAIKLELNIKMNQLEIDYPDLFEKHYFGAFLKKGVEYIGEANFYGKDAWELCYKRWEAGSNLALMLCTTVSEKDSKFHYKRDFHLFENQLGFDYGEAIQIHSEWVKTLNECKPRT